MRSGAESIARGMACAMGNTEPAAAAGAAAAAGGREVKEGAQ